MSEFTLEDTLALQRNKRRRRRRLLLSLLLFILLAGAGYYSYITYFQAAPEVVEDAAPATAQARRGNLLLTAAGVGTLLPAKEINLAFGIGGTVKAVAVQVGDRVAAGDVLAILDDTDLRLQVVQTGIDLRQAELQLAALTKDASVAQIAAAQAALASAQADYDQTTAPPTAQELLAARNQLASAQQSYNSLVSGISSDEATTLNADLRVAEINRQQAQWDYDEIAWRGNAGASSQAATLQSATIAYEKALAQYNLTAAGPKAEELSNARAQIASAQEQLNQLENGTDAMTVAAAAAKLTQAQAELADVMSGPSADELEAAQLVVQRAQLNLESVMLDLEGSTIKAPVSGVVTVVDVQIGEQAGTGTVIAVAEQASTQVRFWVEELDITAAVPGNPTSFLFEAFADVEFHGEIVRVEPTLVTIDGAPAVQAWSSIDLTEHPVSPLFNMSVEVEITAGEARNAILVPIQALREIASGAFAVFVVLPDGELEFRPVEVGLRDFVSVEIITGLDEGETVSTGDVDTQ